MSTMTPVKPTGSRTPLPPPAGIARVEANVADWLAAHSVTLLRISLGLVFLGFGILKFFPGASPAEALAIRTVDALTLGVVSGHAALFMTAAMETFIGLTLVTGRGLRAGLMVLAGAMVGILSPLVLFYGDLFPGGLPTIEGQYVFKDIVLAAAGAVVAARALGAAYVVTDEVSGGRSPGRSSG